MITITILDTNSHPVAGVQVIVKDPISHGVVTLGTTDSNGQVVLDLLGTSLLPKTYNVLFWKPFYTFGTQPLVITVTGNQTEAVTATSFQPALIVQNVCACYCYLVDATCTPVVGEIVRAKLVSNFPFSPVAGALATKTDIVATSDASGFVQLNLIQGGTYEISAPALYLTLTNFLIPAVASLDISAQLASNS